MNSPRVFRVGLVCFWAAWSTLVFASNLADAARELGVVSPTFAYASGNFDAIGQVTRDFGIPPGLVAVLFGGVIVWDAATSGLFWRAVWQSGRMQSGDFGATYLAFATGLGLWGALVIADEIFLSYRVASFEQTHRGIFVAMLVSLLVVRLLPGDDADAPAGHDGT